MSWRLFDAPHAHADADRAYTARRKKLLGRRLCPECGYQKPITATGVLMAHQPCHHYDQSLPRCAGSGQPPQPSEATP